MQREAEDRDSVSLPLVNDGCGLGAAGWLPGKEPKVAVAARCKC